MATILSLGRAAALDGFGSLPDIFDARSVKLALGGRTSSRSVNRALRKYVDERLLVKLRNGVYAKTSANQFAVADYLFRGYVGFSSALYLHGLKTEVEDRVMVCTRKKYTARKFGRVTLTPVFFSDFLYGTETLGGVVVSTYAKTLFDMLYKPAYADFFDFYRAINQRAPGREAWAELLLYLERANLTTIRRAGYALDGKAPDWFTKKLSGMSAKVGKSFFARKKLVNFSRKWRIYDDANIMRWKDAV
jgi:predicted transcriptional regulator of viral defense system